MTNVKEGEAVVPAPTAHSERIPVPDDFNALERPPLYFALSRPIGTSTEAVTKMLESLLTKAGYWVKPIKLSSLISRAYNDLTGHGLPLVDRKHQPHDYSGHRGLMRAGDMLRVALGNSVAAHLAVLEINNSREQDVQDALLNTRKGVAYIVTHLMHPDEVSTMRSVYGPRFFLIAANAPRKKRQEYLESQFANAVGTVQDEVQAETSLGGHRDRVPVPRTGDKDSATLAKELISIDAGILSSMPLLQPKSRLNVDETFHLADLFIRARAKVDLSQVKGEKLSAADQKADSRASAQVERLVAQIFSDPFGTPTVEENAMAAAFLAAKSSVAMGRSVGAALVDRDGSLVSTGWNEVAKPFGGPYREGDTNDYRDHAQGLDPSDPSRVHAIRSFLGILLTPSTWRGELASIDPRFTDTREWLEELAAKLGDDKTAPTDAAIAGLAALEAFDNTRIMHLIEFGRSVHAEMAALSDAFRRSVGAEGSTMYVTTFPCHECARNLVSFGIRELYYVEPYGKSMAESLYATEIVVFPDDGENDPPERVQFVPFEGIAPSRIESLFSAVKRKNGLRDGVVPAKIGSKVDWSLVTAPLRPQILAYPHGYEQKIDVEIEIALLSFEVIVAREIAEKFRLVADKMNN